MCNSEAIKEQKKEEWFGMVRWCREDLKEALESTDHPVTEDNIDALFCALDNDEDLIERMISAGWDFIYDTIDELERNGELD